MPRGNYPDLKNYQNLIKKYNVDMVLRNSNYSVTFNITSCGRWCNSDSSVPFCIQLINNIIQDQRKQQSCSVPGSHVCFHAV